MKDYQALNPNPSLPVGYVDSVDLISLKIYKLSILSHSKKKNTDVVKKAYRVYRAYSEAWILILRQISLQNLCRPRGKVYMNPTWRKKCRIASPSGFCECFWTHEKKTQSRKSCSLATLCLFLMYPETNCKHPRPQPRTLRVLQNLHFC